MKVEDHIRRKERADIERRPARRRLRPYFAMLTYERPGMLTSTVASFMDATPGAVLNVFDDGSESPMKADELAALEKAGVVVHRMKHGGIGPAWKKTIETARDAKECDCAVLMEDDLQFSVSWLDVMARMYAAIGGSVGFVSCFRPYDEELRGETVLLDGVEAFYADFNTFQVNLAPKELLWELDLAAAAEEAERERTGVDSYLFPQAARLGRVCAISVRSYVAHRGHRDSGAKKAGYKYFPFVAVNPVYELVHGKLGSEPEPERMDGGR